MAKATTTIQQTLNHKREHSAWFAANQALFNRVVAFYFEVIQAHEKVLELSNQEALTVLEQLTHTTKKNPHPVMPLASIVEDLPALFRRAAIHAALGSARSFQGHLKKWRTRKEKVLAKGKKFTERPPVPPRSWNKSVTLYAGLWKERSSSSIMLKIWTGSCWSWVKCHITGRKRPDGTEGGSPQLVRHGKEWWLHTPVEKQFASPAKVEEQVTTNAQTRICAVDLNLDGAIAVCTIQTVEGSTLATRFIDGGQQEGYQMGAPLVVCPQCNMRGHADRNASLKIGQRLLAHYQRAPVSDENTEEKPHAPQLAERELKDSGVTSSQAARGKKHPSSASTGHGTAQKGKRRRMGTPSLSIPPTLRPPME